MTVLTGAPRGRIWTPQDALLGNRWDQEWRFDLLTRDDRFVAPLEGVSAASLSRSVHNTIRTSGSMDVEDPGRIAWPGHHVAVRYAFKDDWGTEHEHPLGIFVPGKPGTDYDDNEGASATVDLYDKMSLLQAVPPNVWTVDRGTSVVAAVTSVLEAVGQHRINAPDDGGGNLSREMGWEHEDSYLRIANDVLDAGGFFSLWVDPQGVWQLQQYVEPARRGIAHEFIGGANALFADHFTHEADWYASRNAVKIVGRSERDEDGNDLPPPFAVAMNNNPDDPMSTVNRGEQWAVESDQDNTGADALGRLAARRLLELGAVTSTYEIAHDWLGLELNSAVRLQVEEHDIDALCVLQSDSWSWSADSEHGVEDVTATLREVRE